MTKTRLSLCLYLFLVLLFATMSSMAEDADADCDQGADCTARAEIGISVEEIRAYPEPDVEQLTYNHELSHDRTYMQMTDAVDIYDSPNGNVIGHLDAGFNFLTLYERIDGWIQFKPGQWIRSEYVRYTNSIVTQFTGVFLPESPLPYTMAWMLVNVVPSTFPGGPPNETANDLVYRYTRVNIYDGVEVEGWRWYQIGEEQWVKQTQVAKVLPVERPSTVETDLWVSIDLYEQVLVAYDGDTPIFATLVATGLPRWPTYEGTFNIYWRRQREDMSWGTPGDDFYYLEEVPWTMFFDEGRALHGAYWHDGFGYRRSHGCVNMSITDAHWLYQWVAEDMGSRASADREEGPAVYVYSSGTYVSQ